MVVLANIAAGYEGYSIKKVGLFSSTAQTTFVTDISGLGEELAIYKIDSTSIEANANPNLTENDGTPPFFTFKITHKFSDNLSQNSFSSVAVILSSGDSDSIDLEKDKLFSRIVFDPIIVTDAMDVTIRYNLYI